MRNDVRVWQVREEVAVSEKSSKIQDIFCLASSLTEAYVIVGESKYRKIIMIKELCPIADLPNNKYKITLI